MVSGREVTQDGIPSGRQDVAEHAPGLHARVRRGRRAGEHRDDRGRARPHRCSDIPPVGAARRRRAASRIYFGEGSSDVAVRRRRTPRRQELDYEGAPTTGTRLHGHAAGIPMGNFLQRALFAWRFKDVNLLISGPDRRRQPDHDLPRHPAARAEAGAVPARSTPTRTWRSSTASCVWIWDAYTTTNRVPVLAVGRTCADATDGADRRRRRELHAQLGEGRRGRLHRHDDVLRGPRATRSSSAWSNAFPGPVHADRRGARRTSRPHFRYPENLFQVQATQFANYHVTDPAVFYQKQDCLADPERPHDPANSRRRAAPRASRPMRPYYVLMKAAERRPTSTSS